MTEPAQTPWYSDKTFLSIFLVPLISLLSKKLGVELNAPEIIAFACTVIAFVASHKYKGAQMAKAAAAGQSAAAAILNEQNKSKQLDTVAKLFTGAASTQPPGVQ